MDDKEAAKMVETTDTNWVAKRVGLAAEPSAV
jgi:hypothetical protein